MTSRTNWVYSKRNKYHAIKTDGCDSRREAKRKRELELEQRAGRISGLQCQVRFELIPTQRFPDTFGPRGGRRPGKVREKKCEYVADFVYYRNGERIVEDSKGHKTPEYIIKRKLMLWVHGIAILET